MEINGSFLTTHLPKFPYSNPFPSSTLTNFSQPGNKRSKSVHCSVSAPSQTKESVPWGCDIDSLENASRLQKWLSKEGLPPQKLAIQRVDVGGRGLVALKNIRNGEKLLFVPQNLIITTDSVWSCPAAGKILNGHGVPEWPFLATYLISEASLKKVSRWSAYISALPRHPGSILQWTRSEVDMYLAASPIKEQAIEHITDVTETFQDLQLRIFSKNPDLFPEKVFNLETFKWAFGILFSRLVRLPSLEDQVALVPWADMLNHSSEVDVFLDFDRSSKGIVFATDEAYQPREQVFISYGKKSNAEILLSYGFVPKEGTNAADSVELSLEIDKYDSCYEQKLEILQKHGLSTPQRFPVKMSGWPMQLVAYAFLVVSPPTMAQQFEKCPLLCKEFIIDAWQLYYARSKGADAVLLIAGVLPDHDIKYMTKICKLLGMATLVEVHNERELDRVLGIQGVELIGINNRDLETFEVDINITEQLLQGERGQTIHNRNIIVVGESGLFTPDDIALVQKAGVRAVLVGESIVKQSDPAAGIAGLFGKDISGRSATQAMAA